MLVYIILMVDDVEPKTSADMNVQNEKVYNLQKPEKLSDF